MKTYGNFYEFTDSSAEILNWVCIARSRDHWIKPMMGVHIENGDAIATDGARLHIAKLPTFADKKDNKPILSDGDYYVIKASPKQVQIACYIDLSEPFPNWSKPIPQGEPTSTNKWQASRMKDISDFSGSVNKYLIFAGQRHALNFKFMDDLALGSAFWDVQIRDTEKACHFPVIFISGSRKAVIMPMNLEENF